MEDNPQVQVPQTQQEPPAEEKVEYATLSERFIALLIDYGFIFLSLQFLASLYFKFIAPNDNSVNSFIAVIIIINVIFIIYETVFSCGGRATLGKALVGISVVRADESDYLSWFRAFLRVIGYYISLGLLGCGFLWAIFDTRHRSLHDLIGGSVVIERRQKGFGEKLLLRGVGIILLMAFSYFFYNNLFGGKGWREQYKVHRAEECLNQLGLLEFSHKRLYGHYTKDYLRLMLLSGDPVRFQRDLNKCLMPKGLKIGVTEDSFKISAYARNSAHTQVIYSRP